MAQYHRKKAIVATQAGIKPWRNGVNNQPKSVAAPLWRKIIGNNNQ